MIEDDCSMDGFVSVRLGFFWVFFGGGVAWTQLEMFQMKYF